MIPRFKFYFYPFLYNLEKRGCCRLYDLGNYIAKYLKLTHEDINVRTKGGRTTQHLSRLNYCASYLKKMKLVESLSPGAYKITPRGREVLAEFGADLTLDDLRNIPEYLATQINATNDSFVYIKPHVRGGKKISAYVSKKTNFTKSNPNIEKGVSDSYRDSLKKNNDSQ